MRLSGALQKKRNSELSYREIVKDSANDETVAAKQVGPCLRGVGGQGEALRGGRESWAELSSREAALGSPCTYRRVPGASQLPPGPSVAGGPGGAWGEGLSKRPLDRCTLGSPGDFFCLFYLFIYLFWLCRDLVTARGIFCWRHVGFSLVVARGLSCPVARRILVP